MRDHALIRPIDLRGWPSRGPNRPLTTGCCGAEQYRKVLSTKRPFRFAVPPPSHDLLDLSIVEQVNPSSTPRRNVGGNFYFLSLRKGVLSRGVRLIKIGELLVVAIMESFRAISIRKLSESRSHRVITRIVVDLPHSFEIREGGGGRNDRGSIAMTYRTGEARRGGADRIYGPAKRWPKLISA